MQRAKIKGIGSKFPENVLTNEDLEEMVDTSDEWITKRTGIKKRRIAGEDVASSDLAIDASKEAIEDAGISAEDIDLIIVATVTPDMPFPSTACIVQKELGLKDLPAFDFSAGCTGFIYGIHIADSFVSAGKYENILVVGVETLSKITDWEDRSTCVLFGDGAGAAIVSPADNQSKILSTYVSADGELGHLLRMPAGGSRVPASQESVNEKLHCIHMEGNDVFKSAVRAMEKAALKGLDEGGLSAEELDWLVPHQANIRIIDFLAKRLDLPKEKVIVTIDEYGNTSAASIPTAFHEAVQEGSITEGDNVLMVAFGAGFTWGSVLIKY